NQDALCAYLARTRVAEPIFPEFVSVQEAISRFSGSSQILLPIGSAKFSLLFCMPGTKVVCIMPAGYAEAEEGVTRMIRHICATLGLKLCFYSCGIHKKASTLLNSDLIIEESDIGRMLR